MLPEAPTKRAAPVWHLVYHRAMDQALQEVEQLGERIEQILATVRRLADENVSLREQLAASRDDNEQLQRRIAEARERVQAALARLPAAPPPANDAETPTGTQAAAQAEPMAEPENVTTGGNE